MIEGGEEHLTRFGPALWEADLQKKPTASRLAESCGPETNGQPGCLKVKKKKDHNLEESKMKRFLVLLTAAILVLGMAVQAKAAFEPGSLTLSLYKSDDADVGHDLGIALATFDFSGLGVLNVSVEKTAFTTNPNWADLRVGIYGYSGPEDNHVFFATTQPTAPPVVSTSWNAFLGADDVVKGTFYKPIGTNPAVGLASAPNSYWNKMDSGTTPGQYAGLNADYLHGEATLEELDPGGQGSVTMYLYKFARVNRDVVLVPGPGGRPYQAEIRISAGPFQPYGAPVIAPIGDASTPEGVPYTGPTPTLLEGVGPVTWSLVTGPAGMTIDSATGVVFWEDPVVAGSPFTVTIRATNAFGFDDEDWLLTVTGGGQQNWQAASTVGSPKASESGRALNYLAFVFLPAAAVLWRKLRRGSCG